MRSNARPYASCAALRTFTPSRMTSGPVPSPARRTILYAILAAEAATGLRTCLRRQFLLQLRYEAPGLENLQHVRRQRLEAQLLAAGGADCPARHVDLDRVAWLHLRLDSGTLEHGGRDVNRVPEEDAGE